MSFETGLASAVSVDRRSLGHHAAVRRGPWLAARLSALSREAVVASGAGGRYRREMGVAFERTVKRFRAELMASLGLALAAGCGPEEKTTSAGETSTSSTGEGTTTAAEDTSSGDTTTDTDSSTTAEATTGADPFSCDPPPGNPWPFGTQEYECFALPMEFDTCPLANASYLRERFNPQGGCSYEEFDVQCGPDATPDEPGACCYFTIHGPGQSCPGRAWTVDGAARTAPVTRRDDWAAAIAPALAELSPARRDELAAAWTAAAAAEHASIASFARFVLQLLAVGAPASLVEETQRAMADEIAHARACYALAGAYAGGRLGPGLLDMSSSPGPTSLAEVAVATVQEGCIGETLAALAAEIGGAHAEDPVVRAVLGQIAADERRHAELAWRFVQWAVARCPDTASRVAAAFAAARQDAAPHVLGDEPDQLPAHGLLSPAAQLVLAGAALREVIAPTAAAMLWA